MPPTAFVSHQLHFDPDLLWPPSLTISQGPVGSVEGDRLLAFVCIEMSTANAFVPTVNVNSPWTLLVVRTSDSVGLISRSRVEIRVYSARNVAGSLPLVATPSGTPTNSGSYRVHLASFRPSRSANAAASDFQDRGALTMPDTSSSVFVNTDGTVVGVALLGRRDGPGDMNVGAISTANGFTERVRQAQIANRGGGFVLADRQIGSSANIASPVWVKPGTSIGPLGVTALIALDNVDPPIAVPASDWGVNRIAW